MLQHPLVCKGIVSFGSKNKVVQQRNSFGSARAFHQPIAPLDVAAVH